MLDEPQITTILHHIEIIYTSKDPSNVQSSNKYLTELITIENLPLFSKLLTYNNLNMKFYSSTAINTLISRHYISIDLTTKESIIKYLTDFLRANCSELYHNSKYIMNNLTTTLAKIIRMTMYDNKDTLILYINNYIINVDIGNNCLLISTFDLIAEIISMFYDREIPPCDKVNRIIKDFQLYVQNDLVKFCLSILNKLCSLEYNKENISTVIDVIKGVRLCLDKIVNNEEEKEEDKKKKNTAQIEPVYLQSHNIKKLNINCGEYLLICNKMLGIYNDNRNEEILLLVQTLLLLEEEFSFDQCSTEGISIMIKNIFTITTSVNDDHYGYMSKLILIAIKKGVCLFSENSEYYQLFMKLCINTIKLWRIDTIVISNFLKGVYNISKYNNKLSEWNYTFLCGIVWKIEEYLQSNESNGMNELFNAYSFNRFLKAFGQLGLLYSDKILAFLFNNIDKVKNEEVLLFKMRLIISILKQVDFNQPLSQTVIDSFICLFKIINSFSSMISTSNNNDDDLLSQPAITLRFISLYVKKILLSHSDYAYQTILYLSNSFALSTPNELIVKILSIIVNLAYSSISNFNLITSASKLINLIRSSLFVRPHPTSHSLVQCIGKIILDKDIITNCLTTLIDHVNKNISNNPQLDKYNILINSSLFRIHLFLIPSNETNNLINLFLGSIYSQSDYHLLFINIIALIRAFMSTEEYILFCKGFLPCLNTITNLYIDTFAQIPKYQKYIIKIFNSFVKVQHLISFKYIEFFPIKLIESFDIIVKFHLTKANKNYFKDTYIHFILKYIKILSNIIINKRHFQLSVTESKVISIWNNLNILINANFSVDDIIGYNSNFKGVYSIIKYFSNISSNKIELCDKIIYLLYQNTDSLNNVILISVHETIFEMGKKLIESKSSPFLQNVFHLGKKVFIHIIEKIFKMLSQGEVTQLQNLSNSLFVLCLIYEKDLDKYTQLLNGIPKNVERRNLNLFKENLLVFSKQFLNKL